MPSPPSNQCHCIENQCSQPQERNHSANLFWKICLNTRPHLHPARKYSSCDAHGIGRSVLAQHNTGFSERAKGTWKPPWPPPLSVQNEGLTKTSPYCRLEHVGADPQGRTFFNFKGIERSREAPLADQVSTHRHIRSAEDKDHPCQKCLSSPNARFDSRKAVQAGTNSDAHPLVDWNKSIALTEQVVIRHGREVDESNRMHILGRIHYKCIKKIFGRRKMGTCHLFRSL